jgi:hypothetical protein
MSKFTYNSEYFTIEDSQGDFAIELDWLGGMDERVFREKMTHELGELITEFLNSSDKVDRLIKQTK